MILSSIRENFREKIQKDLKAVEILKTFVIAYVKFVKNSGL